MTAKYWMTLLVFTVFPAPDSPLKVAKDSNSWILVLWCWGWELTGEGWIMDLHRQVYVVIKGWPAGMTSRGKGRGCVPGWGWILAVSRIKTVFTDEITHVMRMDWFSRSGGIKRSNMRF